MLPLYQKSDFYFWIFATDELWGILLLRNRGWQCANPRISNLTKRINFQLRNSSSKINRTSHCVLESLFNWEGVNLHWQRSTTFVMQLDVLLYIGGSCLVLLMFCLIIWYFRHKINRCIRNCCLGPATEADEEFDIK